MKTKEMEASLFCVHCNDETPHIITYINNKMASVRCEECNNSVETQVDIKKEFLKEIYERISTKPSRISKEYNEDVSRFLKHLPGRVVSKPYRLLRYLNESRQTVKRYKK